MKRLPYAIRFLLACVKAAGVIIEVFWKWLLAIAAIVVAIVLLCRGCSPKEQVLDEPVVPKHKVYLNKILTNEMSELPELAGLDKQVSKFMAQWHLRGLSLSVMRHDSLLFSKGYGWANAEDEVKMGPGHILRMASVSKLITATGIMVLQERGLLSLKDTVFGPRGILCDSIYTAKIKDKNYYKINVEHLLRHQGGFSGRHADPMFSTRDMMHAFRLSQAPDSKTLIACEITRRLGFQPGKSQSYSNFGYLLLSEIIEVKSGLPYEEFIKKYVLEPAGCYDMHLARTYYKDRRNNEVKYYAHDGAGQTEEYNNSGRMVERPYGGSDIEGLKGAGGWVGSTAELCRFVASIDGRDEVPDIISAESVAAMTQYFDENTFSLGWNDTKPTGEWTRTGTLAGTSALVKVYPDGECWILITNTGTYRGPHFSKYTSTLFKRCRESYSKQFPARNLFED